MTANHPKNCASIIKSCNNWFDSCPVSSTKAAHSEFLEMCRFYFAYNPLQLYQVTEDGIDVFGLPLIHSRL